MLILIHKSLIISTLGFNLYDHNKRADIYYLNKVIKLSKLNKVECDTKNVLYLIKENFTFSDSSFFFLHNKLNGFMKNLYVKLFKIFGVLCVLIGMTSAVLPDFYTNLVNNIGITYVIFNFICLIGNSLSLFSRFLFIFSDENKILKLFTKPWEKIIFFCGWGLHFLLDLIQNILSILLQCYITDCYVSKIKNFKVFNLDTYVDKYINVNHNKWTGYILSCFGAIWLIINREK